MDFSMVEKMDWWDLKMVAQSVGRMVEVMVVGMDDLKAELMEKLGTKMVVSKVAMMVLY